jgi:hypothetical protein
MEGGLRCTSVWALSARMRRWISLVMLALLAGALGRGAADEGMRASKPEVRKEIVATIEAQLLAFQKQDYVKAYSYATAELRAQKPIQIFMGIVHESYPEIWTNTRAEYGLVRDDGVKATLLVHVYGKDSNTSYDYTLKKERDGWRIHGVLRHAPKKKEKV